jgi:hypothetical protein
MNTFAFCIYAGKEKIKYSYVTVVKLKTPSRKEANFLRRIIICSVS